jgi:hypothetical protein
LVRLLDDRPTLALLFYRNSCAFLAKHVQELAVERDRRYF